MRGVRWTARVCLTLLLILWLPIGAMWIALAIEARATPSPAIRSTGNDAEWLGHAWVDGRKTQSDVDNLARRLRGIGCFFRLLNIATSVFSASKAGLNQRAAA